MSRFDAARPSGVWAQEFVPTAADYQRWDVAQSKFLNASDGGIWNPTSPIRIGGAGMTLNGGCNLFGGVTIGAGAKLTHGTNDVVTFGGTARTRTIVVPMLELQFDPTNIVGSGGGTVSALDLDDYVQVAPPPAVGIVLTGLNAPTFSIPKRFLHHLFTFSGSTAPNVGTPALASATLNFRVLTRPPAVPVSTLTMSVVGYNTAEGISSPAAPAATSWASGTYALGAYVVPATLGAPIYFFRCTTAGTTGGGEPAWIKTPGSTTTDGGVTWLCIGTMGVFYAPSVDSYYSGGGSKSITQVFDWAASPSADALDCSLYRYSVSLSGVPTDGSILYESIAFTFANISSAAFE